ncbi:MAG: hypothetical protein NZM44_06510 [Candidatus Calescibacterium sp.]|nr:hypothetical protein [Candidatus Calescibacterium sp.]
MLKNVNIIEKFEKEKKSKILISLEQNLKTNLLIFENMFELAKTLKIFPLQNILQDIEIDIEYAKIINKTINAIPKTTHKNIKKTNKT